MTSYPKTLTSFERRFLKEYIRVEYPQYANFAHEFLLFLEESNSLSWYTGDSTQQELNSIYHNIEDFTKFYQIDNLPVVNEDVLNAFFKDFAGTLEFRNAQINFSNTIIQNLAKNASNIYNLKSSSRAYVFLFSILYTYTFFNATGTIYPRVYFNDQSDFSDQPPDYFYMDNDKIYISEIPVYSNTTDWKYGAEFNGSSAYITLTSNLAFAHNKDFTIDYNWKCDGSGNLRNLMGSTTSTLNEISYVFSDNKRMLIYMGTSVSVEFDTEFIDDKVYRIEQTYNRTEKIWSVTRTNLTDKTDPEIKTVDTTALGSWTFNSDLIGKKGNNTQYLDGVVSNLVITIDGTEEIDLPLQTNSDDESENANDGTDTNITYSDLAPLYFNREEITTDHQGTRPFRYQTVSKVDIIETSDFSERLQKNVNPAGFFNEILTVIDDIIADIYIDCKCFPKVVSTVETETFCVDFDPLTTSSCITMPLSSGNVYNGGKISFWFKKNGSPIGTKHIIFYRFNTGITAGFEININDSTNALSFVAGTTTYTSDYIVDSEWHYYEITLSGTSIIVDVDHVLEDIIASVTFDNLPTAQYNSIDFLSAAFKNNGNLANFKIEVAGSIDVWYLLDNNVLDISGNGNDGVATNINYVLFRI